MISLPTCIHSLCWLRPCTSFDTIPFLVHHGAFNIIVFQYRYLPEPFHLLGFCWNYCVQRYFPYFAGFSSKVNGCFRSFQLQLKVIPDCQASNIIFTFYCYPWILVLGHCAVPQVIAISGQKNCERFWWGISNFEWSCSTLKLWRATVLISYYSTV